MKIVSLFLLFITTICFSQSQKELVEETLYNYINGSSYNQIEQLQSAFIDDATLYLTLRDGFQRLSPETYAGFFKNSTPGEFNGRVGNIIATEIEGDIATAKVEILVPRAKLRFIDFFLLKNTEEGWKIISKTATKQENAPEEGRRVLFIVSNAHYYGNTDLPTGNSFGEIAHAYDSFSKAGIAVDFVSPEGGAVPLRYIDTSDEVQKKQLYNKDLLYALQHTQKPNETDASKYEAAYYIGGGSAMFEVPVNKAIQNIAMEVYEEGNGIIASVCHGTAGIVNLKTQDGTYLVDGKRVNGYPDEYERKDAEYYKTFPFRITQTIEKHGGKFTYSKPNTPHVEVDGRLVTGQNYLSAGPVAKKIIELINTSN